MQELGFKEQYNLQINPKKIITMILLIIDLSFNSL